VTAEGETDDVPLEPEPAADAGVSATPEAAVAAADPELPRVPSIRSSTRLLSPSVPSPRSKASRPPSKLANRSGELASRSAIMSLSALLP